MSTSTTANYPTPIRILLVDDDQEDFLITKELLHRCRLSSASVNGNEFLLDWVDNFEDALRDIQKQNHDVYLIDYYLGAYNGLDLVKKATISGYRAPIIILTGQDDRSVDLKAMQAGATDFLIKGKIDEFLLERSIRYGLKQTFLLIEQQEALMREQCLNELTFLLSSATQIEAVLNNGIKLIVDITGADAGFLGLISKDKSLDIKYSYNITSLEDNLNICLDSNVVARQAISSQKPVCVNLSDNPLSFEHSIQPDAHQILSAPIIAGNTTFGVLGLFLSSKEKIFDQRDVALANAIARQVGIALQNTTRYSVLLQQTEELRQAKETWEATFNSVPEMIIITDTEGRVLLCNIAACHRLALPAEEVPGKSLTEIFYGEALPPINQPYSDIQFPLISGRFALALYPILGRNVCHGTIYIIQDISEQKRIETTLIASQKLADLGTLAAGVAHELNSPLQVITGVCDDLLNDLIHVKTLESAHLRKSLNMISRNAWRSAEIVRSLLLYARPSKEEYNYHDLNHLIQDALLLIEHQLKRWSNINVNKDLSPVSLPLYCDRNQIIQAIINLVTNARDAIDHRGEITLRTMFNHEKQRLVFQVMDSGKGIPENILPNIFTPFFTTKPTGKGTGLGLSIVSSIIQAHDGQIEVESCLGKGSTFSLYFPSCSSTNNQVTPI